MDKRPRSAGRGAWDGSRQRRDWTAHRLFLALTLLAALLVALCAPAGPVHAAPQIPEMWSRVTSPNVVGGASNTRHPSIFGGIPPINELAAVAAVSASDVWAVGTYNTAGDGIVQTLTEHWNGASWSVVPSVNVGGTANQNQLLGVAAISSADVWAVGSYFGANGSQTLIEQWNGSSWNVVPSPNGGVATDASILYGVVAVTASDVWAVGDYYDPNANPIVNQTLIEQWNGTKWSILPSADVGGATNDNLLYGVTAVSASDVWAVGSSGNPGQTLIEQWNGTAWNVVSSPNPGGMAEYDVLQSVAAVSASDVWAVGTYYNSSTGFNVTLIEQWNGTSWNVVTSPNAGGATTGNLLFGVAAVSASDVWAVGYYNNTTTNLTLTLIEQWNGTSWSIVPGANGGTYNTLQGVAAVSATDVWAVGDYESPSPTVLLTLTERYGYLLFGPTPGTTRGATGRSIR